MENDGGRLNFSMGIDLSPIRKDAEEAMKLLSNIGGEASRQSAVIDGAMGGAGAAGSFAMLEAAVRSAGRQISGMEFGTAQEKIGALSYAIQQNETLTASMTATLDEYREKAREAFERGDDAALQSLTADIESQIGRIGELTNETAGYRAQLEGLMEMSGAGTSGDTSPIRLYDSEADIAAVEALKERITDLSAQIAQMGASGGDTSALTAELSRTRDELNSMQEAASGAAAALGSDLGGRASAAQRLLHQLNTEIGEQQEKIDTLSGMLEEASAEYDRVRESGEATSEEIEAAAAAYDTLSQRLSAAREQMSALEGAQQTAQRQWEAVSQEVKVHDSAIVKMCGGYQNYQQMLGMLPGPVQKVVGGIQGMTSASMKFIATPIGATITALTLAIKALTTWFKSSTEGQKAFAEISGYVNGVLGQLKEIVIKVGEAIYKAFTDPKEALNDFVNALKDSLMNRLNAVGKMGAAIGKIFQGVFDGNIKEGWATVKEGFSDMNDALAQFATGVEDVGDKIKTWAEGVQDAATESAAIKSETRQLELEVGQWQIRKQELDKVKAEASAKMYDSSASAADRQKALDEYKAALQEELDTEQRFADKRVELQERSMALTTNGDEDYQKLYGLQAAAKAVETRGAQELASLQRRANSINRAITTEAGGIESAEQLRAKAFEKSGETIAALITSNNQMETDLLQDGTEKSIRVLEERKKKQTAELEALKQQFIDLNVTTGVKTGDDGLTKDQREQYERGSANIKATYDSGLASVLEDQLGGILTYEQKRQKIEEEYSAKRRALYEEDGETLKAGVEQGNVDELERQRKAALESVDEEFASREDSYQDWCDAIAAMTLDKLKETLDKAQAELAEAEGSGASGSKLAAARASVTKAEKAYEKAQKEANKEQEDGTAKTQRTIEEWNDLREALNDAADAFKTVGDEIGGTAGEALSMVGQISSKTVGLINNIIQFATTSISGIKTAATAGAKAVEAVEAASTILAVIAKVAQVVSLLVSLFSKDNKLQDDIDSLQEKIDALQWELSNETAVRIREQIGSAVEVVQSAYDAIAESQARALQNVAGLSASAANWIARVSVNIGRATQNENLMNEAAQQIVRTYTSLGYKADKVFGDAKYDISETLTNYAQQMLALEQMIEDEKDMKKPDESQITEWEEQMDEMAASMQETLSDAIESIIGQSSDDIATKLGDAFFDAFESGEDAAEAWGDAVQDIVADIVKSMFVNQYLSGKIADIFEKYASQWYDEDGIYQGYDAVNSTLQDFADDLNGLYDEFEDQWSALNDVLGGFVEEGRTATTSGIATASQETVDELNGRATAIQGHTYIISENSKLIVQTTNLILQSVVQIEANTGDMRDAAAAIQSGVTYLRSTVDDIYSKGVRIKS